MAAATDLDTGRTRLRRGVLAAMSGLLVAVFVATLAMTIVTTALPAIMHGLGGSPQQYGWVIAAMLLAVTASGPVWGKLADRMSRNTLLSRAIALFAIGSLLAGAAPDASVLITARVIQGAGLGGLLTIVQIVMASLVGPRKRGAYMGLFSGVSAVATVGGPLLGGVVVETPFLGWRWCFWIGIPGVLAALPLLRRTAFPAPVVIDRGRLDWAGALLIPAGTSVLLVWLSLSGHQFPWLSGMSAGIVGTGLAILAVAVAAERRAADPLFPQRILGDRTVALSIVASATLGAVATGVPVLLVQYFQLARGYSPTQAGLLTLPLIGGLALASLICGRLIARSGRWKRHVVTGGTAVVAGLILLASLGIDAPLAVIVAGMVVLALGIGASRGTLVVAAQNRLEAPDLGTGTSAVLFFHLLGGAVGVAALSAVVALFAGGPDGPATAHEHGTAAALAFGAGVAAVGLVAGALLRPTPLRRTVDDDGSG